MNMASSDTGLPNSWKGSLWSMTGRSQVVTFIGAGGKTTCLRALTQEIDAAGQRVITTTTTKVFPEEAIKGWENPNPPSNEQEGACFWYVKVEEESGKWIGPPLKVVDDAIGSARGALDVGTIPEFPRTCADASPRTVPDLHECENHLRHAPMQVQEPSPTCIPDLHWVIEGDGAKGLKLKCWEPHEPQIPSRSDCVVLVLDGGLWGKVLQAKQVHRLAGCRDLLGHVWNAETAWRYFLRSPVFAPQYGRMSWVILLNAKAFVDSDKSLLELSHKWVEIQGEVQDLEYRPSHLRLAAGDAKEGKLQWFDLW